MARSNKREEHAAHEAWAIPYGDLVTLLMAFFVVMYAVSVVDAGKYRVLSNSLIEAFGAPRRVDPIQIGDPILNPDPMSDGIERSLSSIDLAMTSPAAGSSELSPTDELSPSGHVIESVLSQVPDARRQQILLEISEVAGEIESALGSLMQGDLIRVNREAYWLEIEINTSLLFLSGSATLEPSARPILVEVAKILSKRKARIHVEGHTDNLPINNPVYPSNWELSSGRAASVVNLFASHGIDPQRMVAIGYGEFRPVADNATPEGRAENRRVAVVVLPGLPQRSSETIEPERLKGDYETLPAESDASPTLSSRGLGQL